MLQAIVIGAGQAGLAAAYHLLRLGLEPRTDFVVLDGNDGPGGAWRHRWPSLTFGGAHGIHDLPGMPLGTPDPHEPAAAVVARYYGEYEQRLDLPIVRPAPVRRVESDAPGGPLRVVTDRGAWETALVINATGTWDRPYWPHYPGRESFRGRQLHTRGFRSADEFRGQHVVVVGGGTSAVQFLLQLRDAGATTTWSTRRPPQFTDRPFDTEWGLAVERSVAARTASGKLPASIVSDTGLPLTPEYRRGIADGTLVSAGPLAALEPDGVLLADRTRVAADAVLWATGFRPVLDHLAPLRLREPDGGILTDGGVQVFKDPRVLLAGYGPSASTLGATRAGRAAAVEAVRRLETLVPAA